MTILKQHTGNGTIRAWLGEIVGMLCLMAFITEIYVTCIALGY